MTHAVLLVVGLIGSNVFMTLAWYAHLKNMNDRPWYVAALVSWGIALFEYLIQVPANRAGHQIFTMSQLRLIQEVIGLSVFVPIAVFYLREKPTWNYLWAGLCMVAAVWFIFRDKADPVPQPPATEAVVAVMSGEEASGDETSGIGGSHGRRSESAE
ncbi:MAG TPA: DMT family protein [Pirellulaceae bacterium]|nr:DMT family protein [Pirellulaceae bacterium]